MDKIRDYKCTISDAMEINIDIIDDLNLKFPEAHQDWQSMVKISKAIKYFEDTNFCKLPFCHTVEAEALGGIINLGNEKFGPRVKDYIYSSIDELLNMEEIDFSKGRVKEVLLACKELKSQGEFIVLEISGPITILSSMIDIKYISKAMRKEPEKMKLIFKKTSNEILKYANEAIENGVNMISYADSTGGVNILGPKMAREVVENFTYDFLVELEKILKNKTIIHLCPKTTFAIIDTGKANFVDIDLKEKSKYIDGCKELIGISSFVGETCIKNINKIEKNKMRTIVLNKYIGG